MARVYIASCREHKPGSAYEDASVTSRFVDRELPELTYWIDGQRDRCADATQWLSKLDAAKKIVLYVHGFRNPPLSAVTKAREMAESFGMDVVAFSWPCLLKTNIKDSYEHDSNIVQKNSARLRVVLGLLYGQEKRGPHSINVLAHSMGNRVTVRALRANGPSPQLAQLAFAAADVDCRTWRFWLFWTGPQEWENTLSELQDMNIGQGRTLYCNAFDVALGVAQIPNGLWRAGSASPRKPFRPNVVSPAAHLTVDTTEVDLRDPPQPAPGTAKKVFKAGDDEHLLHHGYFMACEAVKNDIGQLFRGEAFTNRKAREDWWVIT